MKKRMIAALAALVVSATMLTGCSLDMTGSAYQEHYIVDEETGVNYLFVNSDSGVAICPRYNADGSLYTGK